MLPIVTPIRTRRSTAESICWRTGEPGYSSIAPNAHAAIMNAPSRLASMTYSTQCARKNATAPTGGAAGCGQDCAAATAFEVIPAAAFGMDCVFTESNLRV